MSHENKKLKILWFGIYRPKYPRNAILMDGLRDLDVEIIECNEEAYSYGKHWRLLKRLIAMRGTYDCIYCAYPSPSVVLTAKVFGGKPLVVDALYSMYEVVVHDRAEYPWYHPRAAKLWILDWISIILGGLVVTDTNQHAAYWQTWPFVNPGKFLTVPIGVFKNIYATSSVQTRLEDDPIEFLFFGSYIPLHGAPKIVRAVHLLRNDSRFRFTFIGNGQEHDATVALVYELGLEDRFTFVDRKIPPVELMPYIETCHAILGIFGDTNKAQRAVSNKIFEGLSCKRPVVCMDTPSIRDLFSDKDLFFTENDPESIARIMVHMADHPDECQEKVDHGFQTVQQYFPKPMAKKLLAGITTMLHNL